MKPLEFVLWLNGAAGVVGDEPPTQEQWDRIKAKMSETIGGVFAQRILKEAEERITGQDDMAKASQMAAAAMSKANFEAQQRYQQAV